jgi:hypothetical protein
MGGRELKNQAQAYLEKAAGSADVTRLAFENVDLRRQIDDLRAQMAGLAGGAPEPEAEDKSLEDCTDAELKAFIKRETGEGVKGNPSRETLLNRALEIATAPDKAA